jgi:hypothetical protein
VDHVASTFRENDHADPRLDQDGKVNRLLLQQYEGYKRQDPPEKQQKAAPSSLIIQVTKNRSRARARAIGRLVVLGHFFALRSCEYLKVPSQQDRRTKLLTFGNIRFNLNGNYIPLSDRNIHNVDFVALTFVDQKNGERMETVSQFRSGHQVLCPVRAAASIVSKVTHKRKEDPDLPVNTFITESNCIANVTSDDVRRVLRVAATVLGEEALGFKPSEIGTHSIKSGAAMAMHLAEVPVYTIMIIGRWSSDAFLRYIRKQVAQFSQTFLRVC